MAVADSLNSLRLNNANDWINTNLPPSGEIIRDTYSSDGGGYTAIASWESDSKRYDAYFSGSDVASLRVDLEQYDVTVATVIACIKEPESYLAYRAPTGERLSLVFELWYPAEGRIFRGELRGGTQNVPTHVTPDLKIRYLEITEIVDAEEMAVRTSSTSANAQTRLDLLRPWIQEWDKVIFEPLAPQYIPP